MAGLWYHLFGRLRSRADTGTRIPIKAKFEHFQAVGVANDAFLRTLSEMVETSARGDSAVWMALRKSGDSLCESLRIMVRSLIAMSGGRYAELRERCEVIEREVTAIVPKETSLEPIPLVVWPEEANAIRPEIVGGKAANLARWVTTAGEQVPPFFAVSAGAYQRFILGAGLADRAKEVLSQAEQPGVQTLRRLCESICREILSAPLPRDLEEALAGAYARLCGRCEPKFGVAVRSSAVTEDSESSFAGQFETVLGVKERDLAAAYKRVIASKFTFQAVHYARLCGFHPDDVAMPVMVMIMVQPVSSGVAFSRAPAQGHGVLVTAVPGLAQAMMDGRVVPERVLVSRDEPHALLERNRGIAGLVIRCGTGGGLIQEVAAAAGKTADMLPASLAADVARTALRIEKACGTPQDLEWAVDDEGTLFVVQSRPLRGHPTYPSSVPHLPVLHGFPVLISGATRACGGTAFGAVARVTDLDDLDEVPQGAVLVASATSPKLSAVMERIAAIVTEAGSPTGHMAIVAHEFGVPTLVGATAALAKLKQGALVTVNAWSGNVYEGKVTDLLKAEDPGRRAAGPHLDPARARVNRLLDRVASLSLKDPRSPDFSVENCRSLHDVARFVHQKAMHEMFQLENRPFAEPGSTQRLRFKWQVPIEVRILDLGDGVRENSGRHLDRSDILSIPLLALIEGMADPRLRWAGPVGFDLKGFMSIVVRSAADDQRYGEPSLAICSRQYAQFSSRLAYHFSAVDAMCSPSENQNYARFVFMGGAAVAHRRENRAHFLATILKRNGYEVSCQGDRVEAMLGKRPAEAIKESLVMLGRLMASARHLDMLMDNQAKADAYARAFLSGDYRFEFVDKADK